MKTWRWSLGEWILLAAAFLTASVSLPARVHLHHCHYCHHFDFYADYDYDVCAEYDDFHTSDDSDDDGYRDHEINPPDGDDDTDNFGDDHADD